MRKLVFSVFLFILLTVPSNAEPEPGTDGSLIIFLGPVQFFVVNNSSPLTFTYDQYSDFGVAQDLGDVNYDLISNVAWQVWGQILDGTGGGQTADDWDGSNWTLSVNGVAVNETSAVIIDSDPNPANRDDALWEVLLSIPWPESVGTPDCQIELTAETV